jgi:hypothetical protein
MSILTPAHKKANDFVQTLQNPFGKFLTDLATPIYDAANKGTLTYDQAKAALDQFNQQWTAFDTAAQQFKLQGGDYAKVFDQAYGIDPKTGKPTGKSDFMNTVTGVRDTLTAYVNSLQPPDASKANQPPPPPDPTKPTGTGGQTAQQAAQMAAQNTKKRNMAGTGFMSTILGGSISNTTTARPTLLGY